MVQAIALAALAGMAGTSIGATVAFPEGFSITTSESFDADRVLIDLTDVDPAILSFFGITADVNDAHLGETVENMAVGQPNFEIVRDGESINLAGSVSVTRIDASGNAEGVEILLTETVLAGEVVAIRSTIFAPDTVSGSDLDLIPIDVALIPSPGAAALIGVAGLVGFRRRR